MPIPLRHAAAIPYDHPYDVTFTARYGWTRAITVLDDHRCFKLLPQFASWTKHAHECEAMHALQQALILRAAYIASVHLALRTYGDQGPLISGIVREHFPIETKDILRSLARHEVREMDRSCAHWQAAGRRVSTWRAERDRLQKESSK